MFVLSLIIKSPYRFQASHISAVNNKRPFAFDGEPSWLIVCAIGFSCCYSIYSSANHHVVFVVPIRALCFPFLV